jgi:hypothetical protein
VFGAAALCDAISIGLLSRSAAAPTETKAWLALIAGSSTLLLLLSHWRNRIAEQRIEVSPGEIRAYVGTSERMRLPWNMVHRLTIRPWIRRVDIVAVDGKRISFLFELVGFQRAITLCVAYGPFGLGMVAI